MIGPRPICMDCKHLNDDNGDSFTFTCKAFPNGIPDEILFTEVEHTKPFEGDGGVTFEPKRESGLKAKSDDDLASLTHEEYLNVITPQPFLKSSRNFIVQALLKLQQYTDFKNLAPQEAEGVYHSIIDVMTQEGGWSLSQATRKLQLKFPQLSEWEAERIARTETTAIANKARELDFQDSQPPETSYYWGGPDDDRTSDVCREIKERLNGQGLPLGALKALVNEVSVKYQMKPRDWTPHPNCRHTVRIWYGDL